MTRLNETHDPALTSWVPSAQRPGQDFPIQNLPFAVFRRRGSDEAWRGGVAIGDEVVDLAALAAAGVLHADAAAALHAGAGPALNDLMAQGPAAWSALRLALSRALRSGSPLEGPLRRCLVPQDDVEYTLPARIGDYTDFYTSIHHARNVGRLFRPEQPLLPNYQWVPIGYHGRASSIMVSGQAFPRPRGQTMAAGAGRPATGPSLRVDYELEVGLFVGPGNAPYHPIPLDEADDHMFGLCLLNDWSARDVQAWEYQPLGPFLSKNFATTISPWIVTMEALAPYRTAWTRPADEPQPLPYLESAALRREGAFDIQLEIWLQSERMRHTGQPAERLSHTRFLHAYWSLSQMLAHHTVNGCALRPGDLLGSGTVSGPAPEEAGSLLELSEGGRHPISLQNGEQRHFLQDGDTVTLRAYCERHGAARIGFGAASGTLLPPIPAAGNPASEA